MNVHVSYRLHKTPAVEKDLQHQIEKLQKRLQVFRPDLIHLKAMVEEGSGREGVSVSLNLRLPSGQMAAQTTAATATAAVKIAFDDLLQQVNKHKDLLRSSHKWIRRRNLPSDRHDASIPFEETLAAVFPAPISADDIRSYVNVNLPRLERFVERSLYFREAADQIAPDSISKEEVIDETIVAALGSDADMHDGDKPRREKPERLALEPWLYRLALDAIDELSRPEGTNGSAIPLEQSARKRNVKGSDEPELQFHQPDESFTAETIIADDRVSTPEQIVGSNEMMRLMADTLRDVRADHRDAFILYAIEGFGVDEISAITGIPPDRVFGCISATRDHLRKSPQFAHQLGRRSAARGIA